MKSFPVISYIKTQKKFMYEIQAENNSKSKNSNMSNDKVMKMIMKMHWAV